MPDAPTNSKSIWKFDPRTIAGCALWLDAADASATGGGSTVSTWIDKSGFGSNATANSAITLTQNAMGGLPALSFNSSTPQWLLGNTSITSNTLTVFSVFSMQSNSGAAARTVSLAATGANDYNNNSYVGILRQNGTTMGPDRNGAWIAGSFSYATPVLSASVFDGTNAYLYTNGIQQGSYASTGNFTISAYAIAANTNTADAHYWSGYIGEVIVYSNALTTVQRQEVEGYLAWKWLGGIPPILQFTQLTGAGSKIWMQPSFSSNMQTGIAVQNGSGYIWTTTDGGVSWTQRLGPYYWYDAAISADGSTMYAGQYVNPGTPGYLYKSTDGGANWTWLSNRTGNTQLGVACSSNGAIVYASGDSGVEVSSNYGATWTASTMTNTCVPVCCSLNGTIGYAGGFTGYMYVTSNTGASWTTITSGLPGSSNYYFGLACSADGTKAAVTNANTTNVYVSSNTGTSWSVAASVSNLIQIRTYGLAMSSNGNTMYVIGGTSLYKSTDFGVSWTAQSGLTTASGMYSDGGGIACSRDGSNVIVATNNSSTAGYFYKGAPGSSHPFYKIKPYLRIFTPTDIDGCALWLDGNDASTLSLSGSNVTSWNDKSGNANNANIVTSTPPTYANKAVVFTASNSTGLRGNMNASLTNASVFIVASYISNSASPIYSPRLFLFGSNNSTENFLIGQLSLIDQGQSALITYVGNGTGNAFGVGNYQTGGNIPFSTPFLYTNVSTYSGTTFTNSTLVNGAAGVYASNSGTMATGGPYYVGSADRYAIGNSIYATPGANGDSYNGKVYEVIVYPSALTNSQRQQVEGYLAKKWNLTTTTAAFTNPGAMSNCAVWFDAADTSTITTSSGTTLATWSNKGTSGGTATPFSGTTTTGAATYNGSNIVQFAQSTKLTITMAIPNQSRAWFAVFRQTYQLNSSNPYFKIFGAFTYAYDQISGPELSGNMDEFRNSIAGMVSTTSATTGYNVFRIHNWTNSAVSTSLNRIAINGTSLPLTASSLAAGYATGSIAYGIMNGYLPSADLAELICINGEITVLQRQQIEYYLAQKWGISGPPAVSFSPVTSPALPSTHPFVKIPPGTALPFSPLQISGCTLWLDANDPAGTGTPPSAGALATWTDKSGSNNNMTAAGTTPTFSNVPPSAVTFGGAGYYSNATPILSNFYTAFFVFKSTSANAGPLYTTGASSGSNGLFPNESGTTYFTRGDSTWYTTTSPFASNVTNLAVASFSSNAVGSNQYLYYNGSNVVTTTQSNTITYTNFLLGSRQSGGTTYFTGSMYEVIAYNGTLTTDLRQRVEGYLAQKWKF